MESFCQWGPFAYFTETFAAGVIQYYQGQGTLEESPLIQRQDPLEDFQKFDNNDTIFQEYDAPPGDDSKMGWKRSRPSKWWMSLFKAVKYVFCIQILGGLTLGSLAILILVMDFLARDVCRHRNSLLYKIAVDTTESFVVKMWPFLLIITMFGWPLVKKLNLLTLSLLGALLDTCYRFGFHVGLVEKPNWMLFPSYAIFPIIVLINSILVGREIANNSETERSKKIKKTIKVSVILAAQFAFGMPLSIVFVYCIIPLYNRQNETLRAIIAGALPLIMAVPKVIVRLTAQRIDFIHPGDSYVLLSALFTGSAIVFRVMQAELTSLRLFIFLSFVHAAVDLLERLTIVVRDYLWFFIYGKLKRRDRNAETVVSVHKFRTPRSRRLIADMSIQMILGESTALMAAVGFNQLYNFLCLADPSSNNMHYITQLFYRVFIALSIDFVFNSFSFWLQMSYVNIAVVRVCKKKWRKHMVLAFILTASTLCYFSTHLFYVRKQ